MMVIICQAGIGMGTFISFTGINLYLVSVTQILGATKTFFRFELTGRCAMAAGAITGNFLVGIAGIKAPFLVSSALMMCALVFFFSIYSRSETQQSF
jgi:predicted MFS family arabinose efflux permease